MKPILILVALAVKFVMQAQPIPTIQWERNFGGTDNDIAYALDTTSGNGYIIAGSTESKDIDLTPTVDLLDFWIVKLDQNGDLLWKKNYGGSHDEEAYAVRTNPDGSFILVGYSYSDDGNISNHHGTVSYSDCWIVKLNSAGNIVWQKSYGGTADDIAYDVRPTSDGGYIVTGMSNSNDGDVQSIYQPYSNYWVLKLDGLGNLQWQKTYGGSSTDISYSIEQTTDMGFVIVGKSSSIDGDISNSVSTTDSDYWIVKIDSVGNIEWEKSIGTIYFDCATSIAPSPSGGVAVIGTSNNDYRLVEIDLSGNILSDNVYGGSSLDLPRSIRTTNDNGFILGGQSQSDDGDISGGLPFNTDFWLTKIDSNEISWETCLSTPENDYGTQAIQTPDGGYLMTGYIHADGSDASNHYGEYDFWVIKIQLAYLSVEESQIVSPMVTPNPFTSEFSIGKTDKSVRVKIFDLLGNVVYESQGLEIIAPQIANGNYFIRFYDDKKQIFWTEKIIKN